MSVLGIGVRVWVGWCPDEAITGAPVVDARLARGVITAGPYRQGDLLLCRGETYAVTSGTFWTVDMGDGVPACVYEPLLTPISDDDPDAVTAPVEQEVEA